MSGLRRKARDLGADSLLAVLQVALAFAINEAEDALARLRKRVGADEEETDAQED